MMGCNTTSTSCSKTRVTVRTCFNLVLLGGLLMAPVRLNAQPLKLDTCLLLWRQTAAAKSNGLDALMAPGAEGARARLSKAQLKQIKSHIASLERLKFRCRRFVPPPPSADAP